ncbi:hypothetical protein, partial [Pseudomonas aeruginosa]
EFQQAASRETVTSELMAQKRSCLKGSFWPILLKKSVFESAAFRQLKNRSISTLLRENQDSFGF